MAKHDHGNGIISYDSFDEQMEDMARMRAEAISNITPLQRTIQMGGYACNVNHLETIGPIFGAIQSPAEVAAWHQLHYGVGDPEVAKAVLAERNEFSLPSMRFAPEDKPWEDDGFETGEAAVAYYVTDHINQFLDGYLFGNWLSPACPEGELGSGHASVCVPISPEAYLDGKEHGGRIADPFTAFEINTAIEVVMAQMKELQKERGEGDDNSDR